MVLNDKVIIDEKSEIECSDFSVKKMLEQQQEFFRTGITKNIDYRIEQLKKLKAAIMKYEQEISDGLLKDLGKSEFESYTTEIGTVFHSISYTLKHMKKWAKPKKVKNNLINFGAKSMIYPEPLGSVLIIAPFNYPFSLCIEPLVGAIAAGNTAVLKPSEYTPNVSRVISKIIRECFSDGYVSVFEGEREITSALIHSDFDYIFFTGSIPVGKIVMTAAAETLTPVTLELGGKSPCLVHKDANIKRAAERIVWGKFMNCGQTCVAPDYLYVHDSVKEVFTDAINENLKAFYGENPIESDEYGKIVNQRHFQRLVALIDDEKTIIGGNHNLDDLKIAPTVMENITWADPVMGDEIFGPILPILYYNDLDQVFRTIQENPKPLAAYVFSESKVIQDKFIDELPYGGGCVNDTISHLTSPHLPFGGVGSAGMGAYHGKSSFDTFTHYKSILKRSTQLPNNVAYPPFGKKLGLVKKVLK